MEKYDDAPELAETDGEAEYDSPVVDNFFEENGHKAIMDMTTFNLNEFEAAYAQLLNHSSLIFMLEEGVTRPSSIREV